MCFFSCQLNRCGPILIALLQIVTMRCVSSQETEKENNGGAVPKAKAEEFEKIELELSAASEPTPALKHYLLPRFAELKRGSAYPFYARLTAERGDRFKQLLNKASEYTELPLNKIVNPEVSDYLDSLKSFIQQMELASVRDRCDWEYPIREVKTMFILLPDVNEMRMFARVMALKARYHVAKQEYAEAVEAVRVGLAMAKHIDEGPFLVHDLVAIACAKTVLTELMTLMASPDAPNMYWALSALPSPFVGLRNSIDMDLEIVNLSFPVINSPNEQRTNEQWKQALDELYFAREQFGGAKRPKDGPQRVATLAKDYHRARSYFLQKKKFSDAEMDAMSMPELLVRWHIAPWRRIRDQHYKWLYLPTRESRGFMEREKERMKLASDPNESTFFSDESLLGIPAIQKAPGRFARQVAALRIVEAIRMYLAANKKLPSNLDEIMNVPIPQDPMTGEPFAYKRKDGAAILRSRSTDAHTVYYRLTVRKE